MSTSSEGCAAPVGGPSLIGRDATREAVVQGMVLGAGQPVSSAYVRLLDRSGEFTAEVVTDQDGEFRFFAGDGPWTLRVLTPRATAVDHHLTATVGTITEVTITV